MFHQVLNPAGNLALTWLIALAPVVALLVLLAVFRVSAWLSTLIGSFITFLLAVWIWRMPLGDGVRAYLYGSATEGSKVSAAFAWGPFSGGTAIMASWIVIALLLRLNGTQLTEVLKKTSHQMWGACLVGIFIFGLAFVFNFSGMAGSLAFGFSKLGAWFIVVAPILGWIGVALSGSNTSTNAMFGAFQAAVGKLLGFPPLLLPSLNSVGAEVGKPVAPQTASVGVSTSRFVRNEGAVIRHNMAWTLILLVYLILIGVLFYLFFPRIMASG
jgi:lactate permease